MTIKSTIVLKRHVNKVQDALMKKKIQKRSQKVATSNDSTVRISATVEGKWWIKISYSKRSTYLRKYYFSSRERMKKGKASTIGNL